MRHEFLVEAPDGALTRKRFIEIEEGEKLVLDGPASYSSLVDRQAALEAEIKAAGGLEAWQEGCDHVVR